MKAKERLVNDLGLVFVGSVEVPSEMPEGRLSVLLAKSGHMKIPFWL